MPQKECTGRETENETDQMLDTVEDSVSVAKGKGLVTEDKYDEIIQQVSSIRDMNNKLKCLVSEIPQEKTSPESILEELEGKAESTGD